MTIRQEKVIKMYLTQNEEVKLPIFSDDDFVHRKF